MRAGDRVTVLTPHAKDLLESWDDWGVAVRGARGLAETLEKMREEARLYRRLATLRTDVPLGIAGARDLVWRGARRELLEPFCRSLGDEGFLADVSTWQA